MAKRSSEKFPEQKKSSLRNDRLQQDVYYKAVENSSDPIAIFDRSFRFVLANNACTKYLGGPVETIVGKNAATVIGPAYFKKKLLPEFKKCLAGKSVRFEASYQIPDGTRSTHDIRLRPLREGRKGVAGILALSRDITAEKELARRNRTSVKLLEILSADNTIDALSRKVLRLLKDYCGCDAIAMRLRLGDDFPYYKTYGLSKAAQQAFGSLLRKDKHGRVVRDNATGQAKLECLCGVVLQGRTNTSDGHFTPRGSFWTNHLPQFLKISAPSNIARRMNACCVKQGCRSLAMIPLGEKNSPFGLIQFRSKNNIGFNRDTVEFLERMTDQLAIAMERTRSNTALRENEARFRNLFDNAPLCLLEEEVGGGQPKILNVNRCAMETYGWTAEEFESLGVQDLVPPEAMKDFRRVTNALTAGRSISLESLNRRSDGTVFPARIDAAVSQTPSGAKRTIVMVQDITEQKRDAEALRQSREQLQYVIDNSKDAIFQIDLKGNYTFASQSAEKMTGYPMKKLIGMNMRKLIAPEFVKSTFERLKRRIEGKHLPQPLEFDIIRRDGQRVSVELTTAPLFCGGALRGVQGIARNVTEKKRAERALRQSEERYRQLVEQIPAVTYLAGLDATSATLFISPQIEDFLGFPPEAFKKDPDFWMNRLHPDDRDDVLRSIRRCHRTGEPFSTEYRMIHRDGHVVWCHDAASVLRDDEGRGACLQGIMLDISELKYAEAALEDAHNRLLTAQEAERARLAGELHDSLGQSLVAMQLHLQALEQKSRSASDESLHAAIQAAVAECNELIQEVRRISHGLYPPMLESLGLAATLRSLVKHHPGRLIFRCDKRLRRARLEAGTEIALFRIAQESIQNALRHGNASHIWIDLRRGKNDIRLTISNDGETLSPERLRRPGMGLNMMRRRVQNLGGSLDLSSRDGKTRVRVSIPITRVRPPKQPE